MKKYYVTWVEKVNGMQTTYCTAVDVMDKQETKDMVLVEQNYRKWKNLPHMFRVQIGLKKPEAAIQSKTLYTMRNDADQEQILGIKDALYKQGAIR